MAKWYYKKGEESDVVISTRVRLSRNIADYNFPGRLNPDEKAKINEAVKKAILSAGGAGFSYIEMKDLSRLQAISLAERHLISPEFASENEGSALIISEDESVSIMLNEEDHIKIQVMKSGLATSEVYSAADGIDRVLGDNLTYAFDEKLGYLTSSPTNLGTAMRASVLMHLPALAAENQIFSLANTVSKLGISITGAYGNRRQPAGDIYQVSNQITLGITEETAISNLRSIVMQIAARERTASQRELKDPATEDKIYRALGVLQNVRLINTNEFMHLISSVRLGAVNGIINIPVEKINGLITDIQPATISLSEGEISSIDARDAARAAKVRETLKI